MLVITCVKARLINKGTWYINAGARSMNLDKPDRAHIMSDSTEPKLKIENTIISEHHCKRNDRVHS